MTLAEFKAWFEGFTEDMGGTPNEKQFERIKAKVKDIDGVAITKTVFVDRYYPAYRPYWSSNRLDVFGVAQNSVGVGHMTVGKSSMPSIETNNGQSFDSFGAMLDLGKAEYSASLAS